MRNIVMCFVTVLCTLMLQSWIYEPAGAAALTPPSGWSPSRERMNYALGRIYVSVGQATGTTEIAVTGLTATDHILGITNLSDPTETQLAMTAVTAATGKVTFASGSTNAEYYQVIWKRPRPDWSD